MNKKVLLKLIVLLSITGVLFVFWYRSPRPLRMLPTNTGSQSLSVVFMTSEPVKSCMYVYEKKMFLKGKIVCNEKTTTHLLTVSKLTPQTTYQSIIKTGWRITAKNTPQMTTNALSEVAPRLPEPAYGSVRDESNNPINDALVVVFPDQDVRSAVAAKTNIQGNYALDVSTFIEKATTLTVDIQTPNGLWANEIFPQNIHTPFSDIIVKPIVNLENK